MRRGAVLVAGIVLTAAVGGGFWLGRQSAPPPPAGHAGQEAAQQAAAQVQKEREILYYQSPDGGADYSPVPKKDAQGRDFTPVYADPAPVAPPPPAAAAEKPRGKILYYRNPMGLADVSRVPKKDGMGMDYVPVTEGDEEGGDTVKVSLDKVQKLGVRTEAAQLRQLNQPIRAVGTVQVDERKLRIVAPKFEGYIERLEVNQTGQLVSQGQTLMEFYSPDLVLAEQEYEAARQASEALQGASPEAREAAQRLADGALTRLKNWDIGAAVIDRLRKGGPATRRLTLSSPVAGVVLEKKAVQGMRFMAGDMLYQIADLSTVWVVAEVFEQDLARVTVGQPAQVTFNALPEKVFSGPVTFVYPTVTAETRTAKVRIELANHEGHLRPALYGTVEIATPVSAGPVVTVPDSAVLDTGSRQAVLVERGEGLYEPREIRIGARAGGYIAVLDGLKDGEKVVVSANFLIDAESNLKAALQGFHHH